MNASTVPPIAAINGNAVTMTSLELVDFINANRLSGEAELRHDNFMVKVPKVLGLAAPKFLGTAQYINGTGGTVTRNVYRLPKREACLMAMSFSYELQAKVFDRMTELENREKLGLPDFTDPAASAMAWAEQFRAKQLALAQTKALEAKIEADAPKVEGFERLCGAAGSLCLRDSAKALQVQPSKLNAWLMEHHWIYRRVGNRPYLGYQDKVQPGYLTHKVSTYVDERNGAEKMAEQVRITAKGLTRLAQLMKPEADAQRYRDRAVASKRAEHCH